VSPRDGLPGTQDHYTDRNLADGPAENRLGECHPHSGLVTDRCAGHSNAGYVREARKEAKVPTSISSNPNAQ
jgi:hypothetical protein